LSALNARDRRAILVGALVVVPALAFVWGVRPYLDALHGARDRLDAERSMLARERGEIAAAHRNPDLQRVADSALTAMRPRLFEGRDDVMASAQLASYLGEVARRSRVWLQDAATRTATSTTPGVRTLHVDLRAQTDDQGLLEFLQALDHGDRLVRIERMDVSREVGTEGDRNPEVLTITATVAGFAMTDEAAPSAEAEAASGAVNRGGSQP
jgi:Type II secretion system (T2SS), protein M subtype b